MAYVPDDGRANERTALAWQRTALSLVAGSALLSRLTFDRLGLIALSGVAFALPMSVWIFLEGRWRYGHDAGVRSRRRPRDGIAPTAIMVATVAIAMTELAALFTQ